MYNLHNFWTDKTSVACVNFVQLDEKNKPIVHDFNNENKVLYGLVHLTIPSQKATECLFLSSLDLKSHFERTLDLVL